MADTFKQIISHQAAKEFFDEQIALGDVLSNANATMEIEGYGHLLVNTKSFSDVMPTATDGIEVYMPTGVLRKQVSQIKIVAESIPVTIYETTRGQVETMLENILTNGGTFNCTVYEGTPESYVWAKRYEKCYFTSDPIERSSENMTQAKEIIINMTAHYFGERLLGNKKG